MPDLEETRVRLGEIMPIGESDQERFFAEVQCKASFQPIVLLFNLSDKVIAGFAVNRHRFPGVDIAAHPSRCHPMLDLAAHAVGYVGRINERELSEVDLNDYSGTNHIGKLGIEQYYKRAAQQAQASTRQVNAQGRPLRILKQTPSAPGVNLVLSLDMSLQRIASQVLSESNGAVVAIEPTTGVLVALVSRPAYDPDLFVDSINYADYGQPRDDPDRSLFNCVLAGRYPPGSTIKPFMALAGLEYGVTSAD